MLLRRLTHRLGNETSGDVLLVVVCLIRLGNFTFSDECVRIDFTVLF